MKVKIDNFILASAQRYLVIVNATWTERKNPKVSADGKGGHRNS